MIMTYSSSLVYSRCFKVCFFFEMIIDRAMIKATINSIITKLITATTTISVVFPLPEVSVWMHFIKIGQLFTVVKIRL